MDKSKIDAGEALRRAACSSSLADALLIYRDALLEWEVPDKRARLMDLTSLFADLERSSPDLETARRFRLLTAMTWAALPDDEGASRADSILSDMVDSIN